MGRHWKPEDGDQAKKPWTPAPNGLPRVRANHPHGWGAPGYDWDAIMPELLDTVASGQTVVSFTKAKGITDTADVYRKLTSPEWREQYQTAKIAGALAKVDRAEDRLEQLADEEIPNKEKVNAARWVAWHAQWLAERSDPENWGREDRLKVANVSAVRIIVETPPNMSQLPTGNGTIALEGGTMEQIAAKTGTIVTARMLGAGDETP